MKALLLGELNEAPSMAVKTPSQYEGMEDGLYHYKGNLYTMTSGYACQMLGIFNFTDIEGDTPQELEIKDRGATNDSTLMKAMLIARGDKVDDIVKFVNG